MEIIGSALSAAKNLTEALQCVELVEKLKMFSYESELDDLQRTVHYFTAVLHDAETKQELNQQDQCLIEQIKDVIFDADDLMDELVTLAQQQRLMDADGSLIEKVSHFFSRANPIYVSYWMCGGIKDIKKRLDAISKNNQFSFEHDPVPIRKRSRETCSYVDEVDVIGREDELKHIVGTLLDDDCYLAKRHVSFLSIVGMGGLGKTALAQLVFNDQRIKTAFPLRLWTCVADQGQKELNMKEILRMLLASATGKKLDQLSSTLDQIQSQLRQELAGKKYLLVLDDVWNENRSQWSALVQYLVGDVRGSWVVVTTRSQITATIINGIKYELSGLSKDDSWCLFEKTAFAPDQPNPPDHELVNIGREIVDRCGQVPLAIKVAGSLVFGQDKSKWISVQKIGCGNIREEKNDIMPILKLSYHHLASPLKSCFSYCALFPKDFRIEKEMLISLWMAQSYIVPLDYDQSIEDAAEEYFSILLRRCFFQDIEKNKFVEIESCKIHDLMHDIAESVSKKEIYALNSTSSGNVDKKVRHLSIASTRHYGNYPSGKSHIRSHLFVDLIECSWFPVEALVADCRWLRALDLSRIIEMESLPSSIGELLHLRYLDLSWNYRLAALPKSISKLCNLQTFNLLWCHKLQELPKGFSRLVSLRVLDVKYCNGLTYMPRGMGKLSSLERLEGWYILGGEGRSSSWKEWFYGLEDLKPLNNLRGLLKIKISWPEKTAEYDVVQEDNWKEGLYLKSKEHLNCIVLDFQRHKSDETIVTRLMEELQPHYNLKELVVEGYNGMKMPGWANATSLPYIVHLSLYDCEELEYLPLFPYLKELRLHNIPRLKRVGVQEGSSSCSRNPQLQELLPRLSLLYIYKCPELMCSLYCPRLECLHLSNFNERIRIFFLELVEVTVDNVGWLDSMPVESCMTFRHLIIKGDDTMVDLPEWIQHCSTLQTLVIEECENLKAMPYWMPKLTSLRELGVSNCSDSLQIRCKKDPPGEDWPNIHQI